MKYQETKAPCAKNAGSHRPSLANWVRLTFMHSIVLALTLVALMSFMLPPISFMQSALCALVAGAAFACSFSAIDCILSSLLEKPVLCILTFNEEADRTGIIVWVFACFALGYIGVAALGLWLCNILNIIMLRSALDFVATTTLLVAVQTVLIIHKYATTNHDPAH